MPPRWRTSLARPVWVGCTALRVDAAARRATIGAATLGEGDWISLDGNDGTITLGRRTIVTERPADLATVERWRTEGALPCRRRNRRRREEQSPPA